MRRQPRGHHRRPVRPPRRRGAFLAREDATGFVVAAAVMEAKGETLTVARKNAVVTGTSGIALGVAKRLVADGFAVTLCGNDSEQNAAAAAAFAGMAADVATVDVSDADAVARFAADLGARIDALHALVNCAAIQPYGNLETTTPADWEKTIGINLTGYFLIAHFLYPLLKKAGSASIVNFASVQGHMNQNNVLAYATSKGAIHALTRAMAVDCAKDGVRVNSISPGSIRPWQVSLLPPVCAACPTRVVRARSRSAAAAPMSLTPASACRLPRRISPARTTPLP